MPSRMARSLSMQSTTVPASRPASICAPACATGTAAAAAAGARHFDGKARAAAERRFQRNLAVEHARDALDDRQAEADAARHPRALVEPMEFLEDRAALGVRNADAGIVDVDAQPRAAAPAADQHAALPACI